MKIVGIGIENFQGAQDVELTFPSPLAIVAGHNGAGKSSVAEAIELALRGEPVRVSLKKHYDQMVTDGATLGAIEVGIEHAGKQTAVTISLPDGARGGEEHVPASPVLPYLLNPARFAAAKPDDRRTLLFSLTGITAKPDEIERRMLARGCRQDLVTLMKPILRSGFAAGAEFAKKQATDAKGAWRGVTGETYGPQKAVGWAANRPHFDQSEHDAAAERLRTLKQEVEEQATQVGRLDAQAKAYEKHCAAVQQKQDLAGKLPALQAKLEHDTAELNEWQAKVEQLQSRAGTGPRQGLMHDLARAADWFLGVYGGTVPEEHTKALAAYEAQYGRLDAEGDSEAAADLPRAIQARDLMKRSVENDRRDIAAAQAAGADDGQEPTTPVDGAQVEAARSRLAGLREAVKSQEKALEELQDAKRQAASADKRTKDAGAYHEDVLGWVALGEALSPDGIPGDLLAEALAPLNERLANSAEITGWAPVVIDRDMTITAGGRVYGLLSESERWRVDAVIGEALAQLSELRLLLLDRFDVLDLGGRGDLLGWMDELAARGEIDTCIILGTLKKPPAAPSAAFTVHWVGTSSDPIEMRKAA